jgi:hypothetical protein
MNRDRSHYGQESFICDVAPRRLRSTATIPVAEADLFMAVDGFPIIADLRKVALTRR